MSKGRGICHKLQYSDGRVYIQLYNSFQRSDVREGEKATHARFTSDPQMTSQNGICGMRLPLCRPTLTRFPILQNDCTFVC